MTNKPEERLPKFSIYLSKVFSPVNHFFDWIYHSRYNPIYRSGTLAVGFLFILLVTGFYLLFFYKVSHPYESMQVIQDQVALGRWIRALHRYATDGALIAIFFHIIQIVVQGKTWGPRFLAWISGFILLGVTFLSAWTGYVMVWDTHGQVLAVAGAEMLQVFPFLRETLAQTFNGSIEIGGTFFFMNLFLHVAFPLAMVFGIWIHTAKLARTVWFPIKPIFYSSLIALVILSILWPAPLPRKADLLTLVGVYEADLFVGFWLFILEKISPFVSLSFWVVLTLIALSVPWWIRPKSAKHWETSSVDTEACTGCTQCVRDCPFEAITMHPHPDGKKLLAKVAPPSCVSCGVCVASCSDLAIGPSSRDGHKQINSIEDFCKDKSEAQNDGVVILVCESNIGVLEHVKRFIAEAAGYYIYPIQCCGTVHSSSLEKLLETFAGIFVLGCPARNCFNRDGLELLRQRVYEKRVPFLARSVDRNRIYLDANSEIEHKEYLQQLISFKDSLKAKSEESNQTLKPTSWSIRARSLVATCVILLGMAYLSQVPIGTESTNGIIRVGAKIPGRAVENCRELTEEEKAKLLPHMRKPKICDTTMLDYVLKVSIDNKESFSKKLKRSGLHGDSPIFVAEDFNASPGTHNVSIRITPTDEEFSDEMSLDFEKSFDVESGKIYLISYDISSNSLFLKMS